MEKMKLSRDEYDAVVEKYREQNGYDDMSDDEKAAFDEKLDKVVGAEDSGEDDLGENEIRAKVLRRSR